MPKIQQKVAVVVVTVASVWLWALDLTIVNVALPTLGRQFHVTPEALDAVATSFLISLAVVIPVSGWIGDRFGTKRTLLCAIAIFTVASALCGQAHSLGELVLFRVFQGIGGGVLTPVSMAMLYRTFPPEERIYVSRMLGTATSLAPAFGPVLGGVLVTGLSWRWVFYVNLPVGICAFLFCLLFVEESRHHSPGRFDLAGFVFAGTGLASLTYCLSEGPSIGWHAGSVVATGIVGPILVGVLVVVELRTPEPMLDLRLFANRAFRVATATGVTLMMAFFSAMYLISLFYQYGLGLSALASGLGTFPEALGVLIGIQLASRLYPTIGPRRLSMGGACVIAAAAPLFWFVGFDTSLWVPRAILFVMGAGLGSALMSIQAAAFATISGPSSGRASGLFNSCRQFGSAVGVAALTTVLAAGGRSSVRAGHHEVSLRAFHLAYLAAALLALATAVLASFIRDADAAATMRVRRRADASAGTPPVAAPIV